MVTSSPGFKLLPQRNCKFAFPLESISYNAFTSSPETWLVMSIPGTMACPLPGKSTMRERYAASMYFQSSNVNLPVPSSHQHCWHQAMCWVACRRFSNSRSSEFTFASTAAASEVPRSSSCSSADQQMGSGKDGGKNLIYSVQGLDTPTFRGVSGLVCVI